MHEKGWRLSPAYDINPSTDKEGLALNIDMDSNFPDLELAKSVGIYFRLEHKDRKHIIDEVKSSRCTLAAGSGGYWHQPERAAGYGRSL